MAPGLLGVLDTPAAGATVGGVLVPEAGVTAGLAFRTVGSPVGPSARVGRRLALGQGAGTIVGPVAMGAPVALPVTPGPGPVPAAPVGRGVARPRAALDVAPGLGRPDATPAPVAARATGALLVGVGGPGPVRGQARPSRALDTAVATPVPVVGAPATGVVLPTDLVPTVAVGAKTDVAGGAAGTPATPALRPATLLAIAVHLAPTEAQVEASGLGAVPRVPARRRAALGKDGAVARAGRRLRPVTVVPGLAGGHAGGLADVVAVSGALADDAAPAPRVPTARVLAPATHSRRHWRGLPPFGLPCFFLGTGGHVADVLVGGVFP